MRLISVLSGLEMLFLTWGGFPGKITNLILIEINKQETGKKLFALYVEYVWCLVPGKILYFTNTSMCVAVT